MAKKIVRLTPSGELVKFVVGSDKLVAQLPEWKRGLLEASSRTTNTEARTPASAKPEETHSPQKVKR